MREHFPAGNMVSGWISFDFIREDIKIPSPAGQKQNINVFRTYECTLDPFVCGILGIHKSWGYPGSRTPGSLVPKILETQC